MRAALATAAPERARENTIDFILDISDEFTVVDGAASEL